MQQEYIDRVWRQRENVQLCRNARSLRQYYERQSDHFPVSMRTITWACTCAVGFAWLMLIVGTLGAVAGIVW